MSQRLRKAARSQVSQEFIQKSADNIDNTFWFNRDTDEPFVGKLTRSTGDKNVQVYEDFLAASAHMSLKSFDGFRASTAMAQGNNSKDVFKGLKSMEDNDRHISLGGASGTLESFKAVVKGYEFAQALLPLIQEERTRLDKIKDHKFSILALLFGMAATLFGFLFVLPVSQLNSSLGPCTVDAASIENVTCSDGSEGLCLNQGVIRIIDEIANDFLMVGFDTVGIANSDSSCLYSTCPNGNSFPFIPADAVGDFCAEFLIEEGIDLNNLPNENRVACSTLSTELDCAFISDSSSGLKRLYYSEEISFVESLNSNPEESTDFVSVPKHPDSSSVKFASGIIFGTAGFLILVAFVAEMALARKFDLHYDETLKAQKAEIGASSGVVDLLASNTNQ